MCTSKYHYPYGYIFPDVLIQLSSAIVDFFLFIQWYGPVDTQYETFWQNISLWYSGDRQGPWAFVSSPDPKAQEVFWFWIFPLSVFIVVVLYAFGKRCAPSLESIWIFCYQRMLRAKFGWNLSSGWRFFLNFVSVFLLFRNYPPPLGKGRGLSWVPVAKEYIVPSLVQFGPLVNEKKIFF